MASAHAQRLAAIYTAEQLQKAKTENTDLLNAGYADAQGDLNDNAEKAFGAIDTGQTAAIGALNTGYDAARGKYADASALFDPFAAAGTKALTQYGDAIGANGATGNDNATAAFRASPGYQYAVDQSSDAVARKNSALGILGSGNTMAEISDRAGHMADQEYSKYTDGLKGMADMGYSATGAKAALTKGIGDLDAGQGTATAGLFNTNGIAKAGTYTTLGQGLAGLDTGLANGLANTNMAVATGQSQAVTSAGQASDAAKNANENLLLGIAGLGVNLLTGKATGSNLTSIGNTAKSIFG